MDLICSKTNLKRSWHPKKVTIHSNFVKISPQAVILQNMSVYAFFIGGRKSQLRTFCSQIHLCEIFWCVRRVKPILAMLGFWKRLVYHPSQSRPLGNNLDDSCNAHLVIYFMFPVCTQNTWFSLKYWFAERAIANLPISSQSFCKAPFCTLSVFASCDIC